MNVGRGGTTATIHNGYIYVTGETDGPSNSVEFYDPKTDEWTQLVNINKIYGPLATMVSNGNLYVTWSQGTIKRYNPWKNCWNDIGPLDNEQVITSSIEIDDQLFVVLRNGKFGHVKIVENDQCSFEPLCKTEYENLDFENYFLYGI